MSAPTPLTPAEADLQDFPFMPLHVARLRDSDLAAEEHPEACWYAVLLWAAAWHQLPAGSLPDNDTVLCKLIGLGRDLKTFKKHRAGALRGWILCSDGRLYHPVVAEQVADAWDSKLRQRHRTLCAAIRKHNERNPEEKRDSPSFEAWVSLSCPQTLSDLVTAMSRVTPPISERDIGSKGQGQGQGHLIDNPDGLLSESAASDLPRDIDLDGEDDSPEGDDPADDLLALKPQHVIDEWNKVAEAHGLAKVRGVTGKRLRHLKSRIREHPLDHWMDAFNAIERNPWMHGENDRGWRADFDFLLQPTSFQKLIEGSYDRVQPIQ